MSKRRYKEYLRDDTAVIPRTTCWRSEQCCDGEVDIEPYNTAATDNLSQLNTGGCEEPDTDSDDALWDVDDFDFNEPGALADNSDSEHSCNSSMWDDSGDPFEESSDVWDGWSDNSDDSHSSTRCNQEQNYGFVSGGNQPIYEGADMTHNQSLVLLMSFVLKHQLTDQALGDFLTIMNMHLPNVVPETKYLFYKKFNHQTFVHHYFCEECSFYFGPSDKCDVDKVCSCHVPRDVESAKINKSYFSYWSLQSQLELILQDDTIAECLLNQPAKNHNDDYITDATDGYLYKNLKEIHGYGPKDISLLWNADGVPVFRSSNKDLWPIQCTILELPIDLRKKNIVMPALWFSKCKLNMNLLLQPFVEETEQLATEGFLFNGHRVRVFAPICSADAPARPKLRNTKQFNGICGCDWCLHAGIQVVRGRGSTRAYPFDEAQKERTHHEMELLALEALEKKTPQLGVKGPSMLSKVSHFDLVNGFVPDFLHCALLGVARQLVSLWFDSSNHESPWYIGQPSKQTIYDSHLKNIVVPKEVRRLPRSITTREHWKGSRNAYQDYGRCFKCNNTGHWARQCKFPWNNRQFQFGSQSGYTYGKPGFSFKQR